RAALEPGGDGHRDLGRTSGIAEPAVAIPQDVVAGQPVHGIEVEVAALERRHQGELVADPDARDGVEIFGHDEVALAARIERDEQEAARSQALLAELREPEDARRRLPVMVDARREHARGRYSFPMILAISACSPASTVLGSSLPMTLSVSFVPRR